MTTSRWRFSFGLAIRHLPEIEQKLKRRAHSEEFARNAFAAARVGERGAITTRVRSKCPRKTTLKAYRIKGASTAARRECQNRSQSRRTVRIRTLWERTRKKTGARARDAAYPCRSKPLRATSLPGSKHGREIGGLLRIAQDVIGHHRPGLSTLGPDLGNGRDLVGLIKCSDAQVNRPTSFAASVSSRVTGRTNPRKISFAAFKTTRGWKEFTFDDLQALGGDDRRHAEGAAGPFLTPMTVADVNCQEWTRHKISNFAATAATPQNLLWRVDHCSLPACAPWFALSPVALTGTAAVVLHIVRQIAASAVLGKHLGLMGELFFGIFSTSSGSDRSISRRAIPSMTLSDPDALSLFQAFQLFPPGCRLLQISLERPKVRDEESHIYFRTAQENRNSLHRNPGKLAAAQGVRQTWTAATVRVDRTGRTSRQ